MKKALMLINNNSGVWNSKIHLLDAMDEFCKSGYELTTYITQAKGDAKNYLLKSRSKYDVVSVFGGDGTLNEVVNALMRKKEKPMIGYFPSGTTNDFGSNFDLGSDFRQIAKRICSDNYTEFDVGEINGEYFDYVAAFGAMCDVPYKTNRKAKEAIGMLAYIFEGINSLSEIKPINIKITYNNKVKKMKVLFGLVFSGGRVAGQQIVSKSKSKIDDGEFNIVLVDYVTSLLQGVDILAILANQNKHVHKYKASEIKIEFEDDDVNWTIDGEKATPGKIVSIKNIKKALKLKA